MKNLKSYFCKFIDKYAIFLIILFFSLVYSFIAVKKHFSFQTFGWDTAIFDQQVYLVNNLKLPHSSLHGFVGLGDHFHPLLYVVGGLLYQLWSHPGMLYIMQASISCLGAWPIFLISRLVLSKIKKLNSLDITLLSLALSLLYLLNVSFQFMVLGEYNDAYSFTLPFLFLIYFLYKNSGKGYWISFILMLLTKEEYSLISVPLGIYILLVKKQVKKALLTILIGLLTFYILTFQIMPAIIGSGEYLFYTEKNQPTKLVPRLLSKPTLLWTKFFDDPEKRKTINSSFTSFGFLPILSPTNLIIPVSSFAIRFYDESIPRRYEFNNQYAAGLIAPLAIASIFGVRNLLQLIKFKNVNIRLLACLISVSVILIACLQNLIYKGPINSVFKRQFYKTSEWQRDAYDLIKMVPKDEVISANNSLLPHLSQRDHFYLLPNIGKAKYIAVDLSNGPNKFAPLNYEKMKEMITKLIEDNEFKIIWRKNDAILLKRVRE